MQSKLAVLVDRMQQLSTQGDKHARVLQALLRRICMNGHIPWNALASFWEALQSQDGNVKATRVLHYLLSMVLGCGAAGAPQLCALIAQTAALCAATIYACIDSVLPCSIQLGYVQSVSAPMAPTQQRTEC